MAAIISFIFEYIGVCFSIGIVFLLLCTFIKFIKDKLEERKRKYIYKHRFDEPPIAKCYCHDCKYYDISTSKCNDINGSRLMADWWFCCFAEPREKENK
jgi:hypothetical protein